MKADIKHRGKSGIYCIRNKINGKVYIGKSKCIHMRIRRHIADLNRKTKDENCHLINSWHKYGRENFEYFVIEFCDISLTAERELFWIKNFNALDRNKGYNLRLDSSTGLIVSQETREKMSISHLKRYKNPEERRRTSEYVKKYWSENPEQLVEMGKKVTKRLLKYKIEQYDKKTKILVKIWSSIIELIETHPEYKRHNIYAVCSGEKPSMYGYIWKKVMI